MILKRRKAVSVWRRVRNFFWPEIGFQRAAKYMGHKVNRITGSPHAIALGFAAGAFASFTPAIGFHFVLAAIIAWAIGANILASAIGTSVGNPLTFPFIWIGTHNVGSFLLGVEGREDIALSGPEGGMALMFADPSACSLPSFGPVLSRFSGRCSSAACRWGWPAVRCSTSRSSPWCGATSCAVPSSAKQRSAEIMARRQAEAEARACGHQLTSTGPTNDPRGWQ
jgi:hypothetical protein